MKVLVFKVVLLRFVSRQVYGFVLYRRTIPLAQLVNIKVKLENSESATKIEFKHEILCNSFGRLLTNTDNDACVFNRDKVQSTDPRQVCYINGRNAFLKTFESSFSSWIQIFVLSSDIELLFSSHSFSLRSCCDLNKCHAIF